MYLSSEKNTVAADRSVDLEGVSHIITDVLYPAVANVMLDGTTALSAVTTGPNDSTVASSKYGTVQSDGRMYYYTDIKGSKPIKDPRIGAHFGSQRHKFKSLQSLDQESAIHGSSIYSIDGREWARSTGSMLDEAQGVRIAFTSGTSDTIEVVGYFMDANILSSVNDGIRTVKIELDGVTKQATLAVGAVVNSPFFGRYVDTSSVINTGLGSVALGIHTIRITRVAANSYFSGIELISQDTTSTATKSQIQIPSQNVVSYGKKFTVAAAHHYDPFNGFVNSTSLHSAFVDTGTSLGLSTPIAVHGAPWAISGTNNIRPYNGGRVVKWVDSSGVIKTSVTMMPPNAQNILGTVAGTSEVTTPSATNATYTPIFSDEAIDYSLAEVAKTFHWREFGNGSANGGTSATHADASMLRGINDNIAYVMDDGLTTLASIDAYVNDFAGGATDITHDDQSGEYSYYTFIGSGVNWISRADLGNGANKCIAQNLPYGTHILRIDREGTGEGFTIDGISLSTTLGTYATVSEITFYQPKMPPIPEDAVVLADYMLMADYVKQTDCEITQISKGVRWCSGSRDHYVNTAGALETGSLPAPQEGHAWGVSGGGSPASGNTSTHKLPFFGTTGQSAIQASNLAHSVTLGGSSTTEHALDSGRNDDQDQYTITETVTLGMTNIETTNVTGGTRFWGHLVVSPIHTSHHYQSFETPGLRELVGGDRNMEQTNMVVTPDGKTWDEVTRDTSYLGNFRWRASLTSAEVGPTTKCLLDDHRGTEYNGKLQLGIKDFAWAYDRLICLVDGEYIIHRTDVWKSDATVTGIELHINNGLAWASMSNTAGHWCPASVSLHCQLKRNDYIWFEGSKANATNPGSYPLSHWWITKA